MREKIDRAQAIFIVVAFEKEAKPLIDFFHLKRSKDSSFFPVFTNNEIILGLSGLGKVMGAACLSFLFTRFPTRHVAVINFGTAGHPTAELGMLYQVGKVECFSTSQVFYPQFPFAPMTTLSDLVTVDTPEKEFKKTVLYDMEFSGIVSVALKKTSLELIHAFKTVSDNRIHPFKIPATQSIIDSLILPHLPKVDTWIKKSWNLLSQIPTCLKVNDFEDLFCHIHFTETQKYQLIRSMQILKAHGQESSLSDLLANFSTADTILNCVNEKIKSLNWTV